MGTTDILAWWGAGLSTLVAAREIWLGRDRLKVDILHGYDHEKHPNTPCVLVRVLNFGKRPIFVDWAGLLWPIERVSLAGRLKHIAKYRSGWTTVGWSYDALPAGGKPYDFPKLLEPGQSLRLWIPRYGLGEVLDPDRPVMRAVAQDGLGRKYISKSFNVRPKPPKES